MVNPFSCTFRAVRVSSLFAAFTLILVLPVAPAQAASNAVALELVSDGPNAAQPHVTAEAAGSDRRRGAQRGTPTDSIAVLSGRVTDATSGSPVSDVIVRVGTKTTRTLPDGSYSLTAVSRGTVEVTFERFGFEKTTQSVTIATGPNVLNAALTPASAVRVTDLSGTVHSLDADTTAFFTIYPLSGYRAMNPLEVCRTDGALYPLRKEDVRRVIGPGRFVEGSVCCPNSPAMQITIELKSGERFDVLLRDCFYYKVEFGGRNRTTGQTVYFDFTKVTNIEFP